MKKASIATATVLFVALSAGVAAAQSGYDLFQQGLIKERAEGNLDEAIKLYQRIVREYASDRTLAAKALIELGQCYEKLGNTEARKAYERVLRDYADQEEMVTEARTRLAALSGGAKTTELVARRVWEGPGAGSMGSPSPDGRYLSFVDWSTGDLALRDLSTGENRHITNKGSWNDSGEWAEGSVFSPDGRQIAYTWYAKDGSVELRLVGVDGSAPRILYKNPDMYYVSPCDWSPDGKNILADLTRKDRTNEIAWVSVADGSVRTLKTFDWRGPGGGFGNVSLSPDGRYIVYDFPPREESDAADIYLLSSDGSREVTLVENPADDSLPTWASDGKHVLFISDRTGTNGLWSIRVEDGKPVGSPELVKADVGRALPMRSTRRGSYYYGLGAGDNDVYLATLDLATGKVERPATKIVQHFEGTNLAPDWSPDGKYLVYTSSRKGKYAEWGPRIILIRSVETGEERELPTKLSFSPLSELRWSPDGRSILFAGEDRKGRNGVYVINAQTGDATEIIKGEPGEEMSHAGWSPDGGAIFYHRGGSKSSRILVRDLKTGQDKEIYRNDPASAYIGSVVYSQDGAEVAFVLNDHSRHLTALEVSPAAGGGARELFRPQGQDDFGSFQEGLAWSPDGRAIIFGTNHQTGSQGGATELWSIPAEGGKPQKLGLAMTGLRGLRFHPDGRRVAFTAGGSKDEVWVLENFLPAFKVAK